MISLITIAHNHITDISRHFGNVGDECRHISAQARGGHPFIGGGAKKEKEEDAQGGRVGAGRTR